MESVDPCASLHSEDWWQYTGDCGSRVWYTVTAYTECCTVISDACMFASCLRAASERNQAVLHYCNNTQHSVGTAQYS